jgi:hypothetical protein
MRPATRLALLAALALPLPLHAANPPHTTTNPAPAADNDDAPLQTPDNQFRGTVVAGPPGCPAIIGGDRVFSLATLQPLGPDLPVKDIYENAPRALSPDGALAALLVDSTNILLINTTTGKQTASFSTVDDKNDPFANAGIKFLAFAGKDKILTLPSVGNFGGRLSVWNITSKKRLRTFELETDDPRNIAVSPDGRLVALLIHNTITLYDTTTGARAATLAPAPAAKDAPPPKPAAPAPAPPHFPARSPASNLPAPIHTPPGPPSLPDARCLVFSNDGHELAAVDDRGRLVVWNTAGKIVFDQPRVAPPGPNTSLVWLPDGAGWILNARTVYSRTHKMVVVHYTEVPLGNTFCLPLSKNRLLITGLTRHQPSFLFSPLPWATIEKSLADSSNALLKPGQPLAIDLHTANLRNDANDVQKHLTDAIAAALRANGVELDPAAPVKYHITYQEKAGEKLAIVQEAPLHQTSDGTLSPYADTGRSATQTLATVDVQLLAPGNAVLWKKTFPIANGTAFTREITDDVVKKSTLDNSATAIKFLPLPTYVPADPALPTLPLYIHR